MSNSLYVRLARRYAPHKVSAISRRQMLQASLIAGSGLLLSGPLGGLIRRPGALGKRVVIVGAGFGGLACGYELKAAGYDVTLIDARTRVGGRVLSFNKSFSEFVPGKNVEGGGELVGSNHPTWVAYADKFGLEFLDVTEDEELSAPVVLGGKALTEAEAEELYEEIEAACQSMNEAASAIDADEPWKSKDAEALDKKNLQQWIDGLECGELGKKGLALTLSADNGVEAVKQSYLGNLAMIKGGGLEKFWSDSEVYRCKGGNDLLAHKLAEQIGLDRIVLGLPVTEIGAKGSGMVVTCKDGRTLECDDVVLAVAPTVWSRIKFPVPGGLSPQMGSNVKYLSRVKKAFWLDGKLSPWALTDGLVSMTWDGTDGQGAEGEQCLTSFSGGDASNQARAFEPAARKEAYARALESLYPGFKENFVESRFMDWPSDQWVKASYSFPAPGQVTTQGPALRKGVGHLHFAGEHCCYQFVGYMEGALHSGVSLAKRLAVRDGVAK